MIRFDAIRIAVENMGTIIGNFCKWIVSKPEAMKGFYGLSPMNEPAHLRNTEKRIDGWNISNNDILLILGKSIELFRYYPRLIKNKKLVYQMESMIKLTITSVQML